MATYNVIEEGSAPSDVSSGSATVSVDPSADQSYNAPQYGNTGAYSESYSSSSSPFSGGIFSKFGIIGVAVVLIGIIIEYSGLAALVNATNTLVSIGSIDTILVLLPVVIEILKFFRAEKIPAAEIFNLINFIVSVCVSVWMFFVFVIYAEFSSNTGVGCYGAAAAGAFFIFLGEAVIAFAAFVSM